MHHTTARPPTTQRRGAACTPETTTATRSTRPVTPDLPGPFTSADRPVVVSVGGEVDVASAACLRRHLARALDGGCTDLVVDLSRMTFLDASGLGELVAARSRAVAAGGRFRLVVSEEWVLHVLRISGLDRTFAVIGSLDDALAGVTR